MGQRSAIDGYYWVRWAMLGAVAAACGGAEGGAPAQRPTGGVEANAPAAPASPGGPEAGAPAPAPGGRDATDAATSPPPVAPRPSATDPASAADPAPPTSTADAVEVESPSTASAPCEVTATSVVCEHRVVEIPDGSGARRVYIAVPVGTPPADGWPAVLLFQGSLFGPSLTWEPLMEGLPFGGFHQGLLQAALLEAGFVVIAPEAEGGLFWQTNAGGDYEAGSDHHLMGELLARIDAGEDFGPIDAGRLYATGISSGGYMTSRMAVSYPGVFRALAIQSGSYATCLGPLCVVPDTLPADHPATLFLHGDADVTVPLSTAETYYEHLADAGVDADLIVAPGVGHQWLPQAPDAVTAWFVEH